MVEQQDSSEPRVSFGPEGRYVIRRELGRGMMGVVYEAEDSVLGRTVALKTIELAFGADEETRAEFEQRFFTEARVAAKLSHPWIVVCHDVGKDPASGRLFIVFEYLKGRTLAERIAVETLDWREALSIVVKMARALQHAHACGVVHRDIKPANVMLLRRGPEDSHPGDATPIKIMDFGVARLESLPARLTRAGQSLGSPLYMSPEQVLGLAATARSDIFALGSVLCTLLLGRGWFEARSIPEILARVVHDEAPAISSLRPGLPAVLDAIVGRALAKRPEDRYDSAAALADDLEDVAAGRTPRHASGLAAVAAAGGTSAAAAPAATAAEASNAQPRVAAEAGDPLASLLEESPLEAVTPDVPSPLLAELTLPVRTAGQEAALENPAEWTLPSWELKANAASTMAAPAASTPAATGAGGAGAPAPGQAPATRPEAPAAEDARQTQTVQGSPRRPPSRRVAAGAALALLSLAGLWALRGQLPAASRPATEPTRRAAALPATPPAAFLPPASLASPTTSLAISPASPAAPSAVPAISPAWPETSPASLATPSARATSTVPPPSPRPTPSEPKATSAPPPVATEPPETPTRSGARLQVEVVHPLEHGRLVVWIDGALVYETRIEAPVSRRIVAITVREGRLLKTLEVEPGRHEVKVELSWDDEHRSGSRVVEIPPGSSGRLEVRLAKLTRGVSLKWSGGR